MKPNQMSTADHLCKLSMIRLRIVDVSTNDTQVKPFKKLEEVQVLEG